jgi:hypothetical protein
LWSGPILARGAGIIRPSVRSIQSPAPYAFGTMTSVKHISRRRVKTGWHFNNGPVRLERGGVLQLLRITQVLLMALTDKKWIQAPILTRPYDL